MNPRFECMSERKPRMFQNRNTLGRNSLQNENPLFRSRRSSSEQGRSSGGISKPRVLSEERKSVFCNPRRSSMGLNECKLVKDPRPLVDKGYQRKKIQELVEFLNDKFVFQITVSKLMSPSKKDFENIFQILSKFFEPDFIVKKIEEDAPRILKTLRYPFIPAKSAFVYVARTNWPTLLGTLLYLMDLIKFTSCIEDDMFFESVDAESHPEHGILLKYIINSYYQRKDDEEREIEVFTAMIREQFPYNIEEIQEKNKEIKAALMETEKERDKIEDLKSTSAQKDEVLKQYEKYFNDMKNHRMKKESVMEKLSKEVAEKATKLHELQNTLAEKQAAYDAQGFDGKKQMLYFESQQKDLVEKLQSKRAIAKEKISDYHDADIQYARAKDGGASVCDEFNEHYSKGSEKAEGIFDTLKNINDPAVKNIYSKCKFGFPEYQKQLTYNSIFQHNDACKSALNEIKQKIDSGTLIVNSIASKEKDKLQEVLCKKSDLSVKIKVSSSQETKKEHDLNAEEKQVLKEVKSFEVEIEKFLKNLDEVRKEAADIKRENIVNKEEYEELLNKRKSKVEMLHDYLGKQKKMAANHTVDIQTLKEDVQKAGNEICDVILRILEDKGE